MANSPRPSNPTTGLFADRASKSFKDNGLCQVAPQQSVYSACARYLPSLLRDSCLSPEAKLRMWRAMSSECATLGCAARPTRLPRSAGRGGSPQVIMRCLLKLGSS